MNQFLIEPHNLKIGNEVVVYNRNKKDYKYNGIIYIIYKDYAYANGCKNDYIVDHFYIKFDIDILNKILLRGLPVVYNNERIIIGNIERDKNNKIIKLFQQKMLSPIEYVIDINKINAVLIWRIAYIISKN